MFRREWCIYLPPVSIQGPGWRRYRGLLVGAPERIDVIGSRDYIEDLAADVATWRKQTVGWFAAERQRDGRVRVGRVGGFVQPCYLEPVPILPTWLEHELRASGLAPRGPVRLVPVRVAGSHFRGRWEWRLPTGYGSF